MQRCIEFRMLSVLASNRWISCALPAHDLGWYLQHFWQGVTLSVILHTPRLIWWCSENNCFAYSGSCSGTAYCVAVARLSWGHSVDLMRQPGPTIMGCPILEFAEKVLHFMAFPNWPLTIILSSTPRAAILPGVSSFVAKAGIIRLIDLFLIHEFAFGWTLKYISSHVACISMMVAFRLVGAESL